MDSQGKKRPQWVRSFLSNFLDAPVLEGTLGDLEEKYFGNIADGVPAWRANLLYIIEALGFIKMASFKREESKTTFGQLIHTIIFFFRLVKKDKSYYLVSMFGLALSLTSFLCITMFVVDELSYDSIHLNRDRVFRITSNVRVSEVDFTLATTQFPAANALKMEFTEIEEAVRMFPVDRLLEVGDKKFEEKLLYVDDSFFKVFSFSLLSGDRENVLSDAGNIVLTKSVALKYFGDINVIGNTIKIGESTGKVVGVMEDVDTHSHVKFDVLIPLSTRLNEWKSESGLEGRENKWFWFGAYTYLMLRQPEDVALLKQKLPAFEKKYFPERYRDSHYELQRLSDIHLVSHKDNEFEPNGDILYVRLFSVLAIVIMIVSSINLINLSYFKITSRIGEVGIRKFLGQNSRKVITQLSIESFLSATISFLIAILICQLFLSQFNIVVGKNLDLWTLTNIRITGLTLVLVLIVSLLSIARPAIRIATWPSNFLLLHGQHTRATGRFRNLLIGLQVGFSFVLLVFSFVVAGQIEFFRKKDLGFDKSNVIIVHMNPEVSQDAFKKELRKNSSVIDLTAAEAPGRSYNGWRFVPEGGSYEKPVMLPFTFSDSSFLRTMKIKLLAGVNFVEKASDDTVTQFLVNKKAAIELGWADDPIGRRLEVFQPGRTEIMSKGKVIGLIDDYHSESLHQPVKPVVITYSGFSGTILVRVAEIDGETIASLESTWKKFTSRPFEFEVLDQQLNKLYSNEEKLSNIMLFFTFVALYLTCYGLFAMSSLLFSSKLKEVAIRKVFGAGQMTIMRQFYSRYALFNVVALLIGVPVAIWVGNLWLETFQYKIELSLFIFLKAAALILIAGMLSVSYYLAKVAWSNPLPFLRRD